MENKIIVYSAEWCSDCQQLKAFMEKHKISCEVRDIQKNPSWRQDLIDHADEVAVPYVVLNGKWIIGYPEGEGYSEEYAKNLFGIK